MGHTQKLQPSPEALIFPFSKFPQYFQQSRIVWTTQFHSTDFSAGTEEELSCLTHLSETELPELKFKQKTSSWISITPFSLFSYIQTRNTDTLQSLIKTWKKNSSNSRMQSPHFAAPSQQKLKSETVTAWKTIHLKKKCLKFVSGIHMCVYIYIHIYIWNYCTCALMVLIDISTEPYIYRQIYGYPYTYMVSVYIYIGTDIYIYIAVLIYIHIYPYLYLSVYIWIGTDEHRWKKTAYK